MSGLDFVTSLAFKQTLMMTWQIPINSFYDEWIGLSL